MKSKTAFNRKELVIAILCGIFLLGNIAAIGAGGRRRAKEALCLSNLRQWGVVWKMFTDDNDGNFLEDQDWIGVLHPYYKDTKLLLCPAATKRGVVLNTWGEPLGDKSHAWGAVYRFQSGKEEVILGSYGLNYWVGAGASGDDYINKYLWTSPYLKGVSEAPLLMDSSLYGFAALASDSPPEYDGEPYWGGTNLNEIRSACINRHSGGINCLFGDFSARKVGLKELWLLKWYRIWPSDGRGNDIPLPYEWPAWMRDFK